jgi:hypothetical protein
MIFEQAQSGGDLNLSQVMAAVSTVPTHELPRLLGYLREIEAAAIVRLCATPRPHEVACEPEQLLDVEHAARKLSVSQDYLYRHWKKLPFAQKCGWGLRFSARGIDEYIRHKGMTLYTVRDKRIGGSN